MTKYFYVKTGGTASGSVYYTTPKTGAWSTAFTATNQYYGDMSNAGAYASADPDSVLCVSNASSTFDYVSLENYGTTESYATVGVEDTEVSTLCTTTKPLVYLSLVTSPPYYHTTYTSKGWWYGINTTVYAESTTGSGDISYHISCQFGIMENVYFTLISGSPGATGSFLGGTIVKDCTCDVSQYDRVLTRNAPFAGGNFFCNFVYKAPTLSGPDTGAIQASSMYFYGADFSQANVYFYKKYYSEAANYPTVRMSFDSCTFAANNLTILDYWDYWEMPMVPHFRLKNCNTGTRVLPDDRSVGCQMGNYSNTNTVYRDNGALYSEDTSSHYAWLFDTTSAATLLGTIPNARHHMVFSVNANMLDCSKPYNHKIYVKTSGTYYKNELFGVVIYSSKDENGKLVPKTVDGREKVVLSSTTIATSTETWNSSTTGSKELTVYTPGDGCFGEVLYFIVVPYNAQVYCCPKVEAVAA